MDLVYRGKRDPRIVVELNSTLVVCGLSYIDFYTGPANIIKTWSCCGSWAEIRRVRNRRSVVHGETHARISADLRRWQQTTLHPQLEGALRRRRGARVEVPPPVNVRSRTDSRSSSDRLEVDRAMEHDLALSLHHKRFTDSDLSHGTRVHLLAVPHARIARNDGRSLIWSCDYAHELTLRSKAPARKSV